MQCKAGAEAGVDEMAGEEWERKEEIGKGVGRSLGARARAARKVERPEETSPAGKSTSRGGALRAMLARGKDGNERGGMERSFDRELRKMLGRQWPEGPR